jgi:hypothetical protein
MKEKVYYAVDRAAVKAQASPEVAAYIEQLEQIIKASYELWTVTTSAIETVVARANALYDEMAVVDFLDEDQ